MNTSLNSLDFALWYSGLLLEILILAAGIYHRHRYPAFLSYIGVSAFKTVTLMYVGAHCSANTYAITYWALAALKIGFLIAVGMEIFGAIFKPINTLPPGTARRMFLIIMLMAVLVIGAACFFPAHASHPLQSFFRTL